LAKVFVTISTIHQGVTGVHLQEPELRSEQVVKVELHGLRPEVLAFAKLMEEKLRKHDLDRGRQGWKDDDPRHLLKCLEKEHDELQDALVGGKNDSIAGECADVANFAMMIADVVGGLK
jgi:NTP pyrophosphatase (non-canonical NTP hydrolase)